jgi:NMD protein affecting ribosome stability and mRNA decay
MKARSPLQRQRRHIDRQFDDLRDDAYRAAGKGSGPALCRGCGAVYRRGRWRWEAAPEGAVERTCAACLRTKARDPAGTVRLSGEFFAAHRGEVLRLLRHEEEREKSRHPMQRIMSTVRTPRGVEISTTDIHIARRLGGALHDAYQGTLTLKQSPDEYRIRVDWKR